jgi:ribonuclease HI
MSLSGNEESGHRAALRTGTKDLPKAPKTGKTLIRGYFDGAYSPSRQEARFGWFIDGFDQEDTIGHGIVGRGPEMTNNVAEYAGLFALCLYIRDNFKPEECEVNIFGDSQMVINMASGLWGRYRPHPQYPHLQKWVRSIRAIMSRYNPKYQWIPREHNQMADDLASIKSGGQTDLLERLDEFVLNFKWGD